MVSFLKPFLVSDYPILSSPCPRSYFPRKVCLSASSSSSARLPNATITLPEVHAFHPSRPAHHASPTELLRYRSLLNLGPLGIHTSTYCPGSLYLSARPLCTLRETSMPSIMQLIHDWPGKLGRPYAGDSRALAGLVE